MARSDAPAGPYRLIMLATFFLVVAALYFAQEVLVPLVLAVLFTFLLTPLVIRLERLRVPRVIAATSVVLLGLCLIGVLGWALSSQAVDLANELPQYKKNISDKVSELPFIRGDGVFSKLTTAADELKKEVAPSAEGQNKPMAVTIANQSTVGMTQISTLLGAILGPLATVFIVAVFVIFMLIRREDLRDRLIRLVGEGRLDITTQALSEAGNRISRYLLMQSLVNICYGFAIGIGLWAIGRLSGARGGFPDAPLWGLLCGLFRFVPYVGPWLGAFFPVVLSIAVFPGAREFIATVCLFVCIEVLNNSAIEPLLYGATTGLSAVAVLAAAVFWSWLWGPIGLLLSTPLTACVLVIGKYVPDMEFLGVILGDEPPLPPATRLYQRLLSLDSESAADVIDEYHKTMSLEALYETVVIPALAMAERDHHVDRLDEDRLAKMMQNVREVLEDLGDREKAIAVNHEAQAVEAIAKDETLLPSPVSLPGATSRHRLPLKCSVTVIALPAQRASDELVGVMMQQLLELRGYCVSVLSQNALASEMLDAAKQKSAEIILVSALPPTAITHARYLCKRLESKFPSMPIVVGLWAYQGDLERARERITSADHVHVIASIDAALEQINTIAQRVMLSTHPDQAETSQTLPPVEHATSR